MLGLKGWNASTTRLPVKIVDVGTGGEEGIEGAGSSKKQDRRGEQAGGGGVWNGMTGFARL